MHDREYERRRPAGQQDTRETLDPRQHPPAGPEDDVAEADRGVGGEGEVDRRLQIRQLARSQEDDGPEAYLEQMEEDDPHEEAEEESHAARHARGVDDVTDAGEPVDEQEHPSTL